MASGSGTGEKGSVKKTRGSFARTGPEAAVDAMTVGEENGTRIYSEQSLARKMRIEAERSEVIHETAMPDAAANYLLSQQIWHYVKTRALTRLQASVLSLSLRGWGARDIASEFRIPYSAVERALRVAKWRIARGESKYDGLYEVYWREVHRYIYRKRRTPNE